ncbi:hypothetical protein COCON_G00230980 [Conger conger]|uniref:Integrase catalytic domain-containing protein n=1 Tax=Conger conger TaxID=82655 RepID=A0A9Q1CVT1_CONCO|nr:hypothetical protein COCON_G00230980 [Conger conger]
MGYMPTDKQMMRKITVPSIRTGAVAPNPSVPASALGQQPSETGKAAKRPSDIVGKENTSCGTEHSSSSAEGDQTPVEDIASPSASNVSALPVLVERTTLHPSRLHENYCRSGSIQWAEDAWKKASSENLLDGPSMDNEEQRPPEIIKQTAGENAGNENTSCGTKESSSAEGKQIPVMHVPSPSACDVTDAPVLVDVTLCHPSRLHEHYCLPGSIQWAEGTWEKMNSDDMKKGPSPPIQMGLRWQWLCLDVKGPLPLTHDGHTHILTVMDLYSKWVEAYPMRSLTAREVALNIHALICQLGFPHQILSRLNLGFLREVNRALKTHLAVEACSLVVYRPDTCTLDLLTQSYIDSMVVELVKVHQKSWDVQLPASLLSLRCREHPSTHYSPFYMLYYREPCTDQSGSRPQPLVEDQLDEERAPTKSPRRAQGQGSQLSGAHTAEPTPALDLQDVEEVLVVQCERCSEWAWVPQTETRKESAVYTCGTCRKVTRRRGETPPKPEGARSPPRTGPTRAVK